MKCSDVESVLPDILDAPAMEFPSDFQAHLRSCASCSGLVADLKMISIEAGHLAESEEPPRRVWVKIAAELRAEGLIREPEWGIPRPVPNTPPRRPWKIWWLAPAAVAIVAAGSYVVSHKATVTVAKQSLVAPLVGQASVAPMAPKTQPSERPAPAASSAPVQPHVARKSGPGGPIPAKASDSIVSLPSTAEDEQFLSVVSTLSPSMRTTYEMQLQAVNSDIRETQAFVDRYPADMDARQHLMDAYRQKELLYQIALDRIQ